MNVIRIGIVYELRMVAADYWNYLEAGVVQSVQQLRYCMKDQTIGVRF
jgi:hypothetical protein